MGKKATKVSKAEKAGTDDLVRRMMDETGCGATAARKVAAFVSGEIDNPADREQTAIAMLGDAHSKCETVNLLYLVHQVFCSEWMDPLLFKFWQHVSGVVAPDWAKPLLNVFGLQEDPFAETETNLFVGVAVWHSDIQRSDLDSWWDSEVGPWIRRPLAFLTALSYANTQDRQQVIEAALKSFRDQAHKDGLTPAETRDVEIRLFGNPILSVEPIESSVHALLKIGVAMRNGAIPGMKAAAVCRDFGIDFSVQFQRDSIAWFLTDPDRVIQFNATYDRWAERATLPGCRGLREVLAESGLIDLPTQPELSKVDDTQFKQVNPAIGKKLTDEQDGFVRGAISAGCTKSQVVDLFEDTFKFAINPRTVQRKVNSPKKKIMGDR